MSGATNFSKAQLEIEGKGIIKCLFNPKDYTLTKSNTWNAQPTPGKSAVEPQFGGGAPYEMTLQLLFDASVLGVGTSVVDATRKLFEVMEASEGSGAGTGGNANKKRPPSVKFVWGQYISFQSFVKSLTIQYQLFAPDGTPLRADVKLSLIQSKKPAKGQNPTTRSDGSLGNHLVREGDTLPGIAYLTYGDPNHWRALAQANGIDDPMTLRRGTALALPRIDG